MQKNYLSRVLAIAMIFLFSGNLSFSQKKAKVLNNSYHSLAGSNFAQDWSDAGLITINDDWSGVPSIQGFRGDGLSGGTGVDPQTIIGVGTPVIDVNINLTNPNIFTTGGVAEFAIANPTIALAGSGTARGAHIILYLNSTGRQNLEFTCNLRDIDGSADNSIQPIAFQYRIGNSGNFTNLPLAFVTDASTGPSLATLVTPIAITLPNTCDNQAQIELRVITNDAVGSDEWIGIDDILITSTAIPTGPTLSIADASIPEGNSGSTNAEFTVSLSVAAANDVIFNYVTANSTAIEPGDYSSTSGTGTITAGNLSTTILVPVIGDTDSESDETFEVNLTNPTGATILDGQGIGTITNDDSVPITISINDISITEGNSGTTNFDFTVTLSAMAAVDVTFSYATANGTATEPGDYTSTFGMGTITAGNLTTTISVPVVGETAFETNETFEVNLTSPTNATILDAQGQGTITNDDVAPPTLISTIQGSGLTSTLAGTTQTIQGIVTQVFTGVGSLNGIYVQEEDADNDADPATSEGIFVFNPPSVPAVGTLVSITGSVIEFGTTNKLTEISPATSISIVSSGNALPAITNITLPIANVSDWERYEGMLVNVKAASGDLLVTENFELGRYGQVVLAAMDETTNQPDTDARIDQFTQFNLPSGGYPAYLAAVAKRTIYLDDAKTAQNTDPLLFGRGGMPLSASNTLRTGDAINNITAVLDHGTDGYKLQTTTPVNFTPANPRPTALPDVGMATLKVGNMNVLNYFNTFVNADCPLGSCRGANNATEFARQKAKIMEAIINTDVDIMSLNEIENDGYGATSAIQDLIDGLNGIQGANTWAFINPSATLSTDAITVGIIYKPAKALPKGASKVYFAGEFAAIGRGALAQTFEQIGNSAEFTAVSVHYKSKGSLSSGVGNTDIGDGQGNNNGQRTRQSNELRDWLADPMTGITDPDIIILGDLNSYAKEDPITTLETAGYATLIPINKYSYQFDGNFGALDHALGTTSLAAQMTGALKYNINADEPIILDYNLEFKSVGQQTSFYAPDEFRSSDHDPVVVGLNLLCEKPVASIVSNPVSGIACSGETITLTGSGGTEYSWNGGAFSNMATFNVTATGPSTIKLIVKDAIGCESLEVEKTVTITPKPAEIVTTETICSGQTYTWAVNGITYSTNTTVVVVNDGCTADQKLVLTVNPTTYATNTITAQTALNGETSFIDVNCSLIAKVEPAATLGASGFYEAKVWVEGAPLTGPYVARHYEIGPVGNDGQSGEATVTLYFTQPEFDAYNLATISTTTTDDLPTGPMDADGINRLRIMKYPGSGDDTGSPSSYTGSPETITPSSVVFENDMWKIVFDVTSFSGFFVNGQTVALPVTLISFSGKKQYNSNLLEWKTANEKAFDGFEIQRSTDAKAFEKIGFVKGKNKENYQFLDKNLTSNTNYYRLKMNDLDGSFRFSKIIAIHSENESSTLVGKVYPNPAIEKTAFVEITTEKAELWKISTFNAQGSLQTVTEIQLSKGTNKVSVDINNQSQGIFFLNLENSKGEKFVRKVLKN